jgi:di/tricarboxylate transporter
MVVFASGYIPMREMNKAGVLLNFVCSVLVSGASFTIIPAVLGVDADEFPEWAENAAF